MVTAIDTNVLVDVLSAHPTFGAGSAASLRRCIQEGKLIVCGPVWAELGAGFSASREALHDALDCLGVTFEPLQRETCDKAGAVFRAYRDQGGRRERIISDFLIGAHAEQHAERLLTRDRGFYRSYFKELTVLDPTSPSEDCDGG